MAHLFTAYGHSPDDRFTSYITRLRDDMRDGIGPKLTYQTLMRQAQEKMDAIEKERAINSTSGVLSTKDQLNALQAKLEAYEKKKQSPSTSKKNKKGGGKKSDSKKKDKDSKRKFVKFPAELKDKAAPSDHSKPTTIEGVKYFYCFTHKWCRHSTSHCKMPNTQHKERHPYGAGAAASTPATTSGTSSAASDAGARSQRAITALQAIIAGARQE